MIIYPAYWNSSCTGALVHWLVHWCNGWATVPVLVWLHWSQQWHRIYQQPMCQCAESGHESHGHCISHAANMLPFSSSRPSRTSKNTMSHICVLVYMILVHTTCFEDKETACFFGRAALFVQPILNGSKHTACRGWGWKISLKPEDLRNGWLAANILFSWKWDDNEWWSEFGFSTAWWIQLLFLQMGVSWGFHKWGYPQSSSILFEDFPNFPIRKPSSYGATTMYGNLDMYGI